MTFFTWNDTMSVGVKALDDDHKKIIVLINKLYRFIKRNENIDFNEDFFTDLLKYINEHSAKEEHLLEQTNYPGLLEHKHEHVVYIEQFLSLIEDHKIKKKDQFAICLITVLCNWWTKHIQSTDMKYKEHLNANGIF